MEEIREKLNHLFLNLSERIQEIDQERRETGARPLSHAEIVILGQMSLLVDEKASVILTLAQTRDMDALLTMENVIRDELRKLLKQEGWIYDEDSYLIWVPKDAKFETLFEFEYLTVQALDPESALLSKAIKAPEKNKQLIREAIASGEFPNLVDRILKNGGNLEIFAQGSV